MSFFTTKIRAITINSGTRNFSSEQVLWLEVIHNAYHDYQHFWEAGARCVLKLQNARDAQKWLFSTQHRISSFLWCCDMVFDNPRYACKYIRAECSDSLPSRSDLALRLEEESPAPGPLPGAIVVRPPLHAAHVVIDVS